MRRRSSQGARVRLRVGAGIAAGILAASSVGLAPAAGAEEQTWFVQRVTTGDAPLRVEYFWSKGSKLRAKTVVAGRPILTLVNGEFYYVIDELAGTGLAIRRSPQAMAVDRKGGRPFGNEGLRLLDDGAEKLGTDKVGSLACEVYRVTDRHGRREACLSQDELHLPLTIEEFDRSRHRTVQTRYLDWSRGFPAPDRFFEPDPRIPLERIEYEEYLSRAGKELLGPAPVLFRDLLHGR